MAGPGSRGLSLYRYDGGQRRSRSERAAIKTQLFQLFFFILQCLQIAPADIDHDRYEQVLDQWCATGKRFAVTCDQAFEYDLFVRRMLVNQEQRISGFKQDVGSEKRTDQACICQLVNCHLPFRQRCATGCYGRLFSCSGNVDFFCGSSVPASVGGRHNRLTCCKADGNLDALLPAYPGVTGSSSADSFRGIILERSSPAASLSAETNGRTVAGLIDRMRDAAETFTVVPERNSSSGGGHDFNKLGRNCQKRIATAY